MKSSIILQLLAEARPGVCPLCDEPLGSPRRRKFCASLECKRLYHQLYGMTRSRKSGRGPALGERHPRSKLTKPQVISMRRRWAKGTVSMRQLARDNGVTFSCVHCVIRGLTWKHVPGVATYVPPRTRFDP